MTSIKEKNATLIWNEDAHRIYNETEQCKITVTAFLEYKHCMK